jgi:outer membrane lipoprotein-sorting protein
MSALVFCAVTSGEAQTQSDSADPQAKMILKRADEARFPSESFEVSVSIRTLESGQVAETRLYRVLSKGNENTIVMVTEPASDQGQIMLMKGRDLWLFLPSVSQPVRLSLGQRLTGEVANGDIARANFSGDYAPKLVGNERVGEHSLYVLDLVAVDRGVTYQRVRYWVREGSFLPHKAEFYSASDRLLKTCMYENFSQLGGRIRPTRLVMSDALRKDQQSVLEYADLKMRDLPDKVFSKDYLKKLQ